MSEGSESSETKPQRRWWLDWSVLEKGLSTLLVLAVLLVTTLLVVLLLYTKQPEPTPVPQSCGTPTCVKEALSILCRTDTEVNPCKDFYAFACNNMPKYATKQNYYGPLSELREEVKAKLEELYSEPIRKEDHHLVKAQKKMYEACLNETAITRNALTTIKEILKVAGGWPVIEGPEWNRTKFDWIQASYKLRQLGYVSSSFLELNIVPDPKNEDKYILQVSIPEVEDVYSKWFNSDEPNMFMADVAEIFGAPVALDEMSKAHQFLKDLQWLRYNAINDNKQYNRTTISQFQKRDDTVDWLNFINIMAGPAVRITQNDFVLFPFEGDLDKWFAELNRPSSRILANYMMWRVVEEMLPYLTDNLLEGGLKPRFMAGRHYLEESRSEFCIKEIRKRFNLNPLDVMYIRKYLPADRRDAVKLLITNITTEVVEVVRNIEWMDPKDKENAVDRISNMNLIVGAPGDYFDDRIFANMHFDLNKTNTKNFLILLSQANRNNQDALYGLINKSTRETKLFWMDLIFDSPRYEFDENTLNIPASSLEIPIFNEKRPNYLNYANVGLALKYAFFNVLKSVYFWSHKSAEAYGKKLKCLVDGARLGKTPIPDYMVDDLIAHTLSSKVSYAAYKKWSNSNEEEPLIAVDYTPNQLFWMSSGYLFCHYTMPYETDHLNTKTAKAFSALVTKVINSNTDIAKDFECPAKSEVGFEESCKIF